MHAGLLLGLAGWLGGVVLGQLGVWKHIDAPLYDAATRWAEPLPVDPRIAAVYVGDPDIALFQESHGRWPWRTRELHAIAAQVITECGAELLGYDVLFAEPALDDEGSDDDLMIALAMAPQVVHGMLLQTTEGTRWAEQRPSAAAAAALAAEGGTYGLSDVRGSGLPAGRAPIVPIDPLLEASTALGHLNPSPDHDFAIRRVPLFLRMDDRLYPSLAMRMAIAALGLTEDRIEVDLAGREIRLHVAPGDVVRVPVDPDGTLWIHYDRPKEEFPAVLYSQLDAAREAGVLDGAYVVVGVSVSASTDTWRTPLAAQHQGFMIHAQILENLLTRRFVRAIQPDRYPTAGPEAALHAALLLAVVLLALVASRNDPRVGWPATVLACAAPLATSMLLLIHGDVWVPPTTAAVSLGAAGLLGVGYRQIADLLEKQRLRRVYERYLSPAVLRSVLDDPALLQLGGARKELTVFFSDIRGFTPYSETVGPMELTERLNEYYGEMIALAHARGATVDKLIGDSLMAFFGDPVAQPDHALRAVLAALDTQERLRELAAEWRARGVHEFGVGIGIATGEVAVGNLGSERFVDYTVVGSVVNLAARLQGAAAAGEILIASRTYALVAEHIEAESLGERTFKGIAGAHEVFRVLGRRP